VYEHEGMGFYFEADAVAEDIQSGKKENEVVLLKETARVMKMMDGIMGFGGRVGLCIYRIIRVCCSSFCCLVINY